MTRDKKEFIEAMLTWFRSPKVGKDEKLDRRFLSSAYDNITQPHWVSVEDELPPKDKAYLAYWQHYGVTKYRYVKAGTKVSRTFSEHITHWMPLPEAPLVTDLNKKDLPPVSWQEGNILVEEEGGEE